MEKIAVLIILFLFVCIPAQGDEWEDDEVVTASEFGQFLNVEDIIIDDKYTQNKSWQEPFFIKKDEVDRDIASDGERQHVVNREPIGTLDVTAEIPFTYPVLTHRSLADRIRKRIKARLKRRSKKANNS